MNRIFIVRKAIISLLAIVLITSASQFAIAQGALIMELGAYTARLLRDAVVIEGASRGTNVAINVAQDIKNFINDHTVDNSSIPPHTGETIFMPPFGPILPGQPFTPIIPLN